MLPIPLSENLVTRQDRTPPPLFALAGLAIAVTSAGLTPSSASAENYDIDCKLILCMPAGFPSGCSDAFDHMIDRLRDGKSPIGFCALSDGSEYDSYDIEYSVKRTTSPQSWQCPVGKRSITRCRATTMVAARPSTVLLRQRLHPTVVDLRRLSGPHVLREQDTARANRLLGQPDGRARHAGRLFAGLSEKFDANVRSDGRTTIRYTD